jgi:outer membrane protein TolC
MFVRAPRFAAVPTARDVCSGLGTITAAAAALVRVFGRPPRRFVAIIAAFGLSGCSSFSPDAGMSVVSDIAGRTIGKDVAFVRSSDDEARASEGVRRLLLRGLTVNAAVQIALLNNKSLQAAYNDLALAETDLVQQSLPPNPTFSISSIAGDMASEVEGQVVGNILALATLPFRSDIARDRFRQAQLKATLDTLRLAADVRRAYYRAVADNELAVLLTNATSTAEAAARLAQKLGETGSINKLDRAREQVFYAETTTDLAAARQEASSSRERLARLLGLRDSEFGGRLPSHLPSLPGKPRTLPSIEVDAVEHRLDLQIARMELDALAKSLDLTEATRFVTMVNLAGIARKTKEPETPQFRERGFDVQLHIPIFDGGEVRVRQAAETYNRALNRLTEKAINVRSEARDAYRIYRSSYDIASRYQHEVLPQRQTIMDELQLQLSSMQVDVFALVTEMRQRVASQRAAIDAKRAFWIAQSDLQNTVYGGGIAGGESTSTTSPAIQTTNGSL